MKQFFKTIKQDFGSWILCVLLAGVFAIGIFNLGLLYFITSINPALESAAFTILCILWFPSSLLLGTLQFFEYQD